jgi:hypothetical protein
VKPVPAVTAAGDVEAGLRDQAGQAADRVVSHRVPSQRADQVGGVLAPNTLWAAGEEHAQPRAASAPIPGAEPHSRRASLSGR